MILWRPVGLFELERIAAASWRAFPPRLPGQPIFYPVLTLRYAQDIARDWNTQDAASGWCGFVTEMAIEESFVARYPEQVVGARDVARELWVPAEDLGAFNARLQGAIRVLECFYGPRFAGAIEPARGLPRSVIEAERA